MPPPARLVENPWPWLLLVGLVAVGIVVWVFLIRGSDKATVPRVVGLRQDAAFERLNDAGFDVKAVRRPAKAPAGQVFAQKPGAGSRLDKDQTVTISVSSGAPTATGGTKPKPKPKRPAAQPRKTEVAMPDVTGRPLPDAGGEVEAAGLVADAEPAPSDEPPGTVLAQEPGAGTKLTAGETVNLQVAQGRGGGAVTIPDVTGLSAAEARAKLWAARLTARTLYRTGKTGIVLGQQPTGRAPAYAQVTISVGR